MTRIENEAARPGPAACPSCGGEVGCQVADALAGGRCWCFDLPPLAAVPGVAAAVPTAIPAAVPTALPADTTCLCRACLLRRRRHEIASPGR